MQTAATEMPKSSSWSFKWLKKGNSVDSDIHLAKNKTNIRNLIAVFEAVLYV